MAAARALFPIMFALAAMPLAPAAEAQGTTPIVACQTITSLGSYRLVQNLTATPGSSCLIINSDLVTIDLAGFSINGDGSSVGVLGFNVGGAVLHGVAVRNGSISNFGVGVSLTNTSGAIVEELRVFNNRNGMVVSNGIVKNNVASANLLTGIAANGVVIGNDADLNGSDGIQVTGSAHDNNATYNGSVGISAHAGSTLVGNTATNNGIGIEVFCPANLSNNIAIENSNTNLVLLGPSCTNGSIAAR